MGEISIKHFIFLRPILFLFAVTLFNCGRDQNAKKNVSEVATYTSDKDEVYDRFLSKFIKSKSPVVFTESTFGIFSAGLNNSIGSNRLDSSDCKFIAQKPRPLPPYLQQSYTACYNIENRKGLILLSYFEQVNSIDFEHEDSPGAYSKFVLVTMRNKKVIDSLVVASFIDQGHLQFGSVDSDVDVVVQKFILLNDVKLGIEAIEMKNFYLLDPTGHFVKKDSLRIRGVYKRLRGKDGYFPVNTREN
jgi:hypothetical protein